MNLFKRLSGRSALNMGLGVGARPSRRWWTATGCMPATGAMCGARGCSWRWSRSCCGRDQGYQGVNGIVLRLETLFGRVES
ncbi:hypothetical protein HML84_03090 [Alcanivorax sp. IO_7]|nr:hypothetical protein HML84_03090 [Alcanivorax sp. IO_7]